MTHIFTIGHSNNSAQEFGALLAKHGIQAIADVRSSPFSRHAPHFNKIELRDFLKSIGVAYVFLGLELGARSDDDSCYVGDAVSYERLSQTPLFQQGIDRILGGSEKFRIAAMCSEREPTECHRTILVARVLVSRGHRVSHILGDGSIEPHEQTMLRLLDTLGMPRYDLLMDTPELITAAYDEREKQIAYRRNG